MVQVGEPLVSGPANLPITREVPLHGINGTFTGFYGKVCFVDTDVKIAYNADSPLSSN